MTKNNHSLERRVASLERACLEDRRRGARNDRNFRGILDVLRRKMEQ